MRAALVALLIPCLACAALGETPDLSKLPPHPRLYIGGLKTAAGYIDPAALGERAKARAGDLALLDKATDINARALSAMVVPNREKIKKVIEDLKAFNSKRGEDVAKAALAFDWIACDLPKDERIAIARHLGDILPGVEDGLGGRVNPFDNNPLRRDMAFGLAALAIADDDPRAVEYFKKAHSMMEDFVRITGDGAAADDLAGRGAFGGGWPEGHDYDRHGSRYAMLYFLGLRSATGIDVFSNSPFWKAKILYQIYAVLPNGRNILPFQDNDNPYLHRFDREVMLVLAREFKDPHARWYLKHVNAAKETWSSVMEFLYDEPSIADHDYSDLPKALHVPGVGWVMARSGWGPNDTYVAFCASDWYVYHQNDAQNVFAIYRNAPLAVKDGAYDGNMHGHYVNYTIRTISYNGILVYDPQEEYLGPDEIPVAANDGGQMIQQWRGDPAGLAKWREQAWRSSGPMRDIVDWKGFETNDVYTYAAAEAGRAYKPGKVPFFSRQILFIYPNWVIVFDRVTAGDSVFAKQFILHAPEELIVSGNEAIITTETTNHTTIPGRLFVKSLLPRGGDVRKVTGEAAYGGRSWVNPQPRNDQFLCPSYLMITAPLLEETSYFLTAMYACDAGVDKAPAVSLTGDRPDKVTVSLEGGKYKFFFAKTGEAAWGMVE